MTMAKSSAVHSFKDVPHFPMTSTSTNRDRGPDVPQHQCITLTGRVKRSDRGSVITFNINLGVVNLICIASVPRDDYDTAPVYVKIDPIGLLDSRADYEQNNNRSQSGKSDTFPAVVEDQKVQGRLRVHDVIQAPRQAPMQANANQPMRKALHQQTFDGQYVDGKGGDADYINFVIPMGGLLSLICSIRVPDEPTAYSAPVSVKFDFSGNPFGF